MTPAQLAALAFALLVFTSPPPFAAASRSAQQTGDGAAELRITVLDEKGDNVASAVVRIEGTNGSKFSQHTDGKGRVEFNSLSAGTHRIHIEALGFERYEDLDLELTRGLNTRVVTLVVAHINEKMEVKRNIQEAQTDPRNSVSFTTVLTEKQIAAMPDDPKEFEDALRAMGGEDATIRVDGFTGASLPPKSQIKQIRIQTDPYAAENHRASLAIIDIFTKPGGDFWHGSVSAAVRNQTFDGRNAFSPTTGLDDYRRFNLNGGGPIFRGRTSLFLNAEGSLFYDSTTIAAILPAGPLNQTVIRPSRTLFTSVRVDQHLTESQSLFVAFQRSAGKSSTLGVGDIDLAERAYSTTNVDDDLRFREVGTFGSGLLNEALFRARWRSLSTDPVTNAPAELVLGAFAAGGAQQSNRTVSGEYSLADNLDLIHKNHSMRAGLLIELGHYNVESADNSGGTFTFSSLEAFIAGRPSTFTQRIGRPRVSFDQLQTGVYFEDAITIRRNLSLDVGLRYEAQTNLRGYNNFAPRAALVWSPFATGSLVIRAGAGIFNEWLPAAIFQQVLLVNGIRERDVVIENPGFPSPIAASGATVLPPSVVIQDPTMKMPYFEQATLAVERRFPHDLVLTVNYRYVRGVDQLRGHNLNAPVEGQRPQPLLGNVIQLESTANSKSQGMNVSISHISKRFFVFASYILSRSYNETDSPLALPSNNSNLKSDWGPALTDARHRISGLVDVNIYGGLSLGTTLRFNSPTPYNITTGFDNNMDTVLNDRPLGAGRNSARGAALVNLNTRLSWSFGIGTGHGGPESRTVRLQQGGNSSVGATATTNKYNFELYIEAYNTLNHANLTNFVGVQTSPLFGMPTAAQAPRRLECGIRFSL